MRNNHKWPTQESQQKQLDNFLLEKALSILFFQVSVPKFKAQMNRTERPNCLD